MFDDESEQKTITELLEDRKTTSAETGNEGLVYELLRRLIHSHVPEYPSSLLSATIDSLGQELKPFAYSFGNIGDERQPSSAEKSRISHRLEMFGLSGVNSRILDVNVGNEPLNFVFSDDIGASLHGIHICGEHTRTVFSTRELAMAEVVLWGCQNTLTDIYSAKPELFRMVTRYCELSKRPFVGDLQPDTMFGSQTLSKKRFEPIRNFINAIRYCAKLDYIKLKDCDRLNTDLRCKKKSTAIRQRASPFNNYFSKVEFDDSVTPEMERQMYEEYIKLLESGYLPDLGKRYTMRLRKYVGRTKSGVFYDGYGCIVVSTMNHGVFVHEYMHAYDSESSSSESIKFLPIVVKYSELISARNYKPHMMEYLNEPTEIHSRCYEMYLCRKKGFSSLLRYGSEDLGMISDPELDEMVDQYFDDLRNRNWEI